MVSTVAVPVRSPLKIDGVDEGASTGDTVLLQGK
jgi:hypothetical protein